MRSVPAGAVLAAGLAAALALSPLPARAVELADGKLSLHGDGEWAYKRTFGDNALLDATPDGNYQTAMLDLVLNARPFQGFTISAQLGFDPQETSAEWIFGELRLTDELRLRFGKIQQPFGNFSELRFAGTTRALFDLPTSVYGPANVAGTAYYGGGLTGDLVTSGGWTLAGDLYGGAVQVDEVEGFRGLARAGGASGPIETEQQLVRDLVGLRLSATSPGDLVLRLSAYAGKAEAGPGRHETLLVYGPSLQYRDDRLWVTAEAFHTIERGGDGDLSAYAAVSWFFTEHLQGSLRYELQRTFIDGGFDGSPLLRHDEAALGAGWWVNPGLVFKASLHLAEGNRFALPEGATADQVAATPPERRTVALVVGTQFAF
jgi:hypothetical protein